LNTLLIDAGNSRLKWARLARGHYRRGGSLKMQAARLPAQLKKLLRSAAPIGHIWFASVAGAKFEGALRRAARASQLPPPRRVRTRRSAGGIRNGYSEPWRLGVDRWVALIGARQLFPDRALCVIDVGTALTVDLLDEDGRHRGGAIIPGPALMAGSLIKQTAGIARRARGGGGGGRGLFARQTGAGLRQGARYAGAALIERAAEEATALLGARPLMVLAGGAAPVVATALRARYQRVDDLVLRGLAVLAGHHTG
jgi:type III pantothenate kinase